MRNPFRKKLRYRFTQVVEADDVRRYVRRLEFAKLEIDMIIDEMMDKHRWHFPAPPRQGDNHDNS